MRIRGENVASMTERLRGTPQQEPVSFIDWQVGVFATGAQYRLLLPALNRPPIFPAPEFPEASTLPTQHESAARDADGLEPTYPEAS